MVLWMWIRSQKKDRGRFRGLIVPAITSETIIAALWRLYELVKDEMLMHNANITVLTDRTSWMTARDGT
jgi:hypothetical protein